MVILEIVEKLTIGGLEKFVINLSNELSKENFVILISLSEFDEPSTRKWLPINKNIHVIHLNKNGKKKIDFDLIINLRRIIKAYEPDIIHTHHLGPLLYATIASLGRKKIIQTEHDIWYLNNQKNFFYRKILNFNPNLKTVVLTEKSKKSFIKKDFKRIEVLNIGINLKDLKKLPNEKDKYKLKESDFVIGTAGRIETVKNHEYMINQARKNPNIYFVIAGSGSLLEKLSENAPDNVIFLGHQNDLSSFFSIIDVFCLPSFNEEFPLILLEAIHANKIIIANDVGSISEILNDDNLFDIKKDLDIEKIKQIPLINKILLRKYEIEYIAQEYALLFKRSL